MASYEVDLSDGSTVRVDSPTDLTQEQIGQYALQHTQTPEPPFGSKLSKFLFPTAGAVGMDIATGAPMTALGAEIGTAIAPGPGTLIGGALGAGANTFLGALAGSRVRQRLQSQATQEQPPPFSSAVKEAVPFGAFGVGGGLAGGALETVSPFLKSAPRAMKMFTRPGTIANTAVRAGAGGFTAGTTQGLTEGKNPFEAVKQGAGQTLPSVLVGGAMQAVPNFMQAGKVVGKAGEAFNQEAEKLVQSYRSGSLPEYLSSKGHEIWDRLEGVVIKDETPIQLGEFVKVGEEKFGKDSPQVEALLDAFGRSKKQVSGNIFEPTPGFLEARGINIEEQGQLAPMFREENIAPQKALDVATKLSGKIKGGAKSVFRKGYSYQDSVNSDARGVIYDVLKSRAGSEGTETINNALKEYGEFATLRNEANKTFRPYGNTQTTTEPGISFLERITSGKQTAQTPDDARLVEFLKKATGNDPKAGLDTLMQDLQSAKSNAQHAARLKGWIIRIGIAYPVIRAILRPK